MGYFWYLAVQTETELEADRFVYEFDASPIRLGGVDVRFSVRRNREEGATRMCEVTPLYASTGEPVVSEGGPNSEEHANLITQIGHTLYDRLLKGPSFEMAVVGVECSCFYGLNPSELQALMRDLQEGYLTGLDGLMISKRLWQKAGEPSGLVARSEATYWIPWLGESFTR